MSHLNVTGLTVSFTSREGKTVAVDNVSLTLNRGEILGIVGESGSGKSVTCYSILGLVPSPPGKIEQGQATFLGEDGQSVDLLSLNNKQLQAIRGRKIGMIFQDPMTSLNPFMTIGSQLIEAYRLHFPKSKKLAKEKAIAALLDVGIQDARQRIDAYPHEFSGGMRQRVMIAMALITEPELLIADEPTTALDVTVQDQILALIKAIQKTRELSVIFISHDLAVVSQIAQNVIVMRQGQVVEHGETLSLFQSPKHDYTKKLIAAIPTAQKPHPFSTLTPTPLLEVKSLSTSFFNEVPAMFFAKKVRKTVVNNVSFHINKGEILGLVGESGSGKSTLGRSIMRLLNIDEGEIILNGNPIQHLQGESLRTARKDFQMIFQDPYASLNPRLTVFDAIAEPLLQHNDLNKTELTSQVNILMDDVGLARKDIRKYPHEFSGGQRQRIAIARALATQPKLIIADEPVSALDVTIQAQILTLLTNLSSKHNVTLLFISHDLAVVRFICDRVMVMRQGTIVEHGQTETIYNEPNHPYTQQLINAIPSMSRLAPKQASQTGLHN